MLKGLCKTRWYARYEAVNAVYSSFHELVQCLTDLEQQDEDASTRYESASLLNKLISFEFVVLLIFLQQAMAVTNATITQLQQEELDVLSAIDMLFSLLVVLQQMRNDDGGFEKIIKVKTRNITVPIVSNSKSGLGNELN